MTETMPEATHPLAGYDPMAPEFQQNPWAGYALLHEHAPVYRHPASGIIFISRWKTVSEVLAAPKIFSSRFGGDPRNSASGPLREKLEAVFADGWPMISTMLMEDPPLQTRYRKSCGKAFSTRRILALEEPIRAMTKELLETWPERGRVDAMNTLSIPLPVRAIGRTLPIRDDVLPKVKTWSDASVAGLGTSLTDEDRVEAAKQVVDMQKYWAGEFEDRKANPKDDVLTGLVQVLFEDETGQTRPLEMVELLSTIQQLMVAGNETTTKAINEGIKLLAGRPDLWARMRKEPEIIPRVVEEILRLASPNQGLFRRVTEDTQLEGIDIPKGSMLWVMFGAANRDADVFPDPAAIDLERENLREHVALGRGAHFCIGAPLARLELRVVFEELTQQFEHIEIPADFELVYEPSYILRGLAALEIEVSR